MPLRFKIALAVAVLGSLLVGAVLWATQTNSIEGVRQQLRVSERAMMDLVADLSREALLTEEFGSLQAYVERASRHPRMRAILVANARDRIVVATDTALIGTTLGTPVDSDGNSWRTRGVNGRTNHLGRLAIEFSDRPYVAAHEDALRFGLLVAGVGIAVSAAVGLLLGQLLTWRLQALAQAAEQLDTETATPVRAIETRGSDEVARLGRTLARMIERLHESFAALRTARDRLLLPTDAMSQGFALWDPDDRLILCNRRFNKIFNFGGTSLQGTPFVKAAAAARDQLIDPSLLITEPDWHERRLAYHQNPEGVFVFCLRNGRFIEVREARTSDGGTVGIYTDVTRDREQQLALQVSERRLRVMMDSVFDAILTTDRRGRIESLNPSAERIFGWGREDAVGLPISVVMSPSDEQRLAAKETLERLLGLQPDVPWEMQGRHRAGHTFPIEVSAARIELEGESAFLFTIRDISERKANERRMVHHATHDFLTSLPNRSLLEERFENALRTVGDENASLAVMFLDLDRFKVVNDTQGHLVGDALLVAVAERLRARAEAPHTIARLGGDEFIFLIRACGEIARVIDAGRAILEDLRRPFTIHDRPLHLTGSIGVSFYPEHGADAETLFKHADLALYQAKAAGKDRVCIYEPAMSAHGERRASMESRLRRALQRGELELHYQPEVDLATGRLRCLEALVRWRHVELGSIPPEDFIPIAEETDLIRALGLAVLRMAAGDIQVWRKQGLSVPRVAVNVSAREIAGETYASNLLAILERYGIQPDQFELELSDRVLTAEAARAADCLDELSRAGVGLTLDDFGSGYTSLGHLNGIPIGRLKIDRDLVQGLDASPGSAPLIRATIAMAKALDIEIVGEGIENAAQWRLLADAGCDLGQGFFISRPLASGEISRLIPRMGEVEAPIVGPDSEREPLSLNE